MPVTARLIRAPTSLTEAEWFLMAVPIAIPCKVLVCSCAAPNAKSKAEKEVFNLGFARREKW